MQQCRCIHGGDLRCRWTVVVGAPGSVRPRQLSGGHDRSPRRRSCRIFVPVGAPLVWGLADSSTSNTGQEVKPGPTAAGNSDTAVAPPRSTITPDIHRRAMLVVTAVDELFGTHTLSCSCGLCSVRSAPSTRCPDGPQVAVLVSDLRSLVSRTGYGPVRVYADGTTRSLICRS